MKVTVINEKESVIYNGEIYSKGESFEVDDMIGKSLMERGYVALPVSVQQEDDQTEEQPNLDEMSYTELKKLAASKGIPANGKKPDLVARILAAEEETETEDEATTEDADEDSVNPSVDLPNTGMPE